MLFRTKPNHYLFQPQIIAYTDKRQAAAPLDGEELKGLMKCLYCMKPARAGCSIVEAIPFPSGSFGVSSPYMLDNEGLLDRVPVLSGQWNRVKRNPPVSYLRSKGFSLGFCCPHSGPDQARQSRAAESDSSDRWESKSIMPPVLVLMKK